MHPWWSKVVMKPVWRFYYCIEFLFLSAFLKICFSLLFTILLSRNCLLFFPGKQYNYRSHIWFLTNSVSIQTLSPKWLVSPTFTHHVVRDFSDMGDFQRHFQLFLYYVLQVFAVRVSLSFPFMRYWIPSSNLWNSFKKAVCWKFYVIIGFPLCHIRQHTTFLLFLQLLLQKSTNHEILKK